MKIQALFSFRGKVSRAAYVVVGALGVLLKFGLDSLLAEKLLHQHWGVWSYLSPLVLLTGDSPVSPAQRTFLLLLAGTSVPFIWACIAMTVKRLRDADLPAPLLLVFFVPLINLLMFLLLASIPRRHDQSLRTVARVGSLSAILPQSGLALGALAATASATIGLASGWFVIHYLRDYGLTLFLAIPFFMGFLATWLHSYRSKCSFSSCITVVVASLILCGLLILLSALDGFVCLLMAAPIAFVLALLGAYVAYAIQAIRGAEAQSGAVLSFFFVLPLLAGGEFVSPPPTPEFKTHTSIEISASPQIVWKHIVSFPRIEEPLNPIFQLGISYPLEAQITGTGLTADRQCIFSSGAFREPILAWEEDKHFAFGVSQEPPLMKESSPYGDIHVRHLEDHDFAPERADFYLTALPGGRTRLDGWTTYQNRMWPGAYWRLWTDTILHQIHLRVFRQVKTLSERDEANMTMQWN